MEKHTVAMPMVALRGMVILPEMVVHFDVSRKKSIEAVQQAMQSEEQKIFLAAQRELSIEEPGQKDIFEMGTVAVVKQVIKMSKNVLRVLVTGEHRAKLVNLESEQPYLRAEVEVFEENYDDSEENMSDNPMAKNLQEIFLNMQ